MGHGQAGLTIQWRGEREHLAGQIREPVVQMRGQTVPKQGGQSVGGKRRITKKHGKL